MFRNSNRGTTQKSFGDWQIDKIMVHQSEGEASDRLRKKTQLRARILDNSYTIQFFAGFLNKKIEWVLCSDRIIHRRHFALKSGTGFPLTGAVKKVRGGVVTLIFAA